MYLDPTDIKSNLVNGFDITDYLVEAENEVNDVAQRLGVRDTASIQQPLHYKIKRYAVVFVLMRLAQDKIGTNQPDIQLEKYRDLYAMYKEEQEKLYSQITYEMVTGNVNSIIARTAAMGGFYRG